ncbi:type II toxin-antitoxin system RelE family toxin [Wenzhouxiangella sp. EGI_FJ10409]|uniref:type II toxin-antitoxin system RelE family toxin n=1 Tax=Wenzhouxiangella sp. EGI_FJ10409 TaxID=3243767 RepID=UPI0035D5D74A
MARYELVVKRSVAKDLRRIPNPDVARILEQIEALREDPRPRGCEKLSGQERYRIRQGPSRILYEVLGGRLIVTVVKVAHRKSVYRR